MATKEAKKKRREPTSILLSKRANAFYIEQARIMQKDGRLLFLTRGGDEIEKFFNIPHKNTSFLLLGTGTSITSSAARLLAESGVMTGFVGSGGSPLQIAVDPVFMTPVSEYRPTEYFQAWMRIWLDEDRRLSLAKRFMKIRLDWVKQAWRKNVCLSEMGIVISEDDSSWFHSAIEKSATTEDLLSSEAVWARRLYGKLKDGFGVKKFKRDPGVWNPKHTTKTEQKKSGKDPEVLSNSFLDHGNYIAYGYAAVALYALGISFALPVLHGKTRRGALVFDVADLFKDAIVMPLAFEYGAAQEKDQQFRNELIRRCLKAEVIDNLIDTIKKCIIEETQ